MGSNTSPEPTTAPASAGERRLARLVVPAPSTYEPHQRIDWIHKPLLSADVDKDATDAADEARGPRLPDV